MCVDFKDVNKACPKDCYPLLRIDQLVDATTEFDLLSTKDSYQEYHQIPLVKVDWKKVSLVTPFRTYYFKVMTFRLKNVGATY